MGIIKKKMGNFNIENLKNDEVRKFYETLSKERLIELLMEKTHTTKACDYIPHSVGNYFDCSDWEHCSNPHADCVNCPLRYKPKGGYWTTTSTGSFNMPELVETRSDEVDTKM